MFEPMRQNINWHWYITHNSTQNKLLFGAVADGHATNICFFFNAP